MKVANLRLRGLWASMRNNGDQDRPTIAGAALITLGLFLSVRSQWAALACYTLGMAEIMLSVTNDLLPPRGKAPGRGRKRQAQQSSEANTNGPKGGEDVDK